MTNPTVCHWRPASEPPEIPEGESVHVIACTRHGNGKPYVFGATFLNHVLLDDYNGDQAYWIGFHVGLKHEDYDEFYQRISVMFWAPMPEPPETTNDPTLPDAR